MPTRVVVYAIEHNKRSKMVAAAMREGIQRCGETVKVVPTNCYRGVDGQTAVFYGFDDTLQRIFKEYRAAGRNVVYVDLGYWGRREGGSLTGYHKVVVNARHPTEYFQAVEHPSDRFDHFRIDIADWGVGDHILLAGMSAKGAAVDGFKPNEWETLVVAELRKFTDRRIIYRPKPSWIEARPIPGTEFAPDRDALDGLLKNCHAVVTHHSNVAIDGLMRGVPAFSMAGAGSQLSLSDLSKIETPWRPKGRAQFCADLAYSQFTAAEMRSGVAWRHLKDEGLI